MTVMESRALTPNCRVCLRVLAVGESAWADDFKVIDVSGETVTMRVETRYTCDECAEVTK